MKVGEFTEVHTTDGEGGSYHFCCKIRDISGGALFVDLLEPSMLEDHNCPFNDSNREDLSITQDSIDELAMWWERYCFYRSDKLMAGFAKTEADKDIAAFKAKHKEMYNDKT